MLSGIHICVASLDHIMWALLEYIEGVSIRNGYWAKRNELLRVKDYIVIATRVS